MNADVDVDYTVLQVTCNPVQGFERYLPVPELFCLNCSKARGLPSTINSGSMTSSVHAVMKNHREAIACPDEARLSQVNACYCCPGGACMPAGTLIARYEDQLVLARYLY